MSNNKTTFYKFDDFCLDTNQRRLLYADKPVSLTPKAYQTLLVLLKNRNQVVEKEFLLNEVWSDTFVEETTLSQNILTLRKTLANYQKGKDFIVTFPRRGFKFVADVQEIVSDEDVFIIEKRTQTHIIAEQEIHNSFNTKIKVNQKSVGKKLLTTKSFSYLSVAIFCLAIGCFSTWYFLQNTLANSDSKTLRFNTIISESNINQAVVSPNGKYIAIVRKKEDTQTLTLQQIDSGNTIEIVPKLNGELIGAVFSPDNEHIFYSIYENQSVNNKKSGILYKVPVLGGALQMIANNVDSLATISPDKKQIVFVRFNQEKNESSLIITDIEGKNERTLAVRQINEGFTNAGTAWSPDGKYLSAAINIKNSNVQIIIIDVETGEQKVLTNQDWNWAGQTIWLNDGIILPVFRENSPTLSDELWHISYPDGKLKLLTNGIKGKFGISLNEKTDSIVAIKTEKLTCFLSAAINNFRKSNHISTRVGDSCALPIGADWTNDGKIVYSTMEGGNADIWTTDENGGGKRQITSDKSAEVFPQISKDGRFLVFLSNRSGKMDIWRANADGTNPTQLTDNENVKEIFLSPDGNSILYLKKDAETSTDYLWKISINGDNKIQLTNKTTKTPRISPDGKTIASYFLNSENKMLLTLLSAEDGDVIKTLETPQNDDIPFLNWSKDGENLYVIIRDGKPFSLWKISTNNQITEKMREWENDAIFRFVISKDGERVFYEVGTEINSVVQFER